MQCRLETEGIELRRAGESVASPDLRPGPTGQQESSRLRRAYPYTGRFKRYRAKAQKSKVGKVAPMTGGRP